MVVVAIVCLTFALIAPTLRWLSFRAARRI
jgi:hypothetical protein